MSESRFRYFACPHQGPASTWEEGPRPCGGCGRLGPGYAGPYQGEGEIDFLCEDCLAGGRLAELGGLTNPEADEGALLEQLGSTPRARALATERTREVTTRTPLLVTWQDFQWPAHCGDYCRFEGEVGAEELDLLSSDGDGLRFFRDHALDPDGLEELDREDLPPHAPRDGQAWSMGIYHFRCLGCGRSMLHWDAD